jgi:hypothetical protein
MSGSSLAGKALSTSQGTSLTRDRDPTTGRPFWRSRGNFLNAVCRLVATHQGVDAAINKNDGVGLKVSDRRGRVEQRVGPGPGEAVNGLMPSCLCNQRHSWHTEKLARLLSTPRKAGTQPAADLHDHLGIFSERITKPQRQQRKRPHTTRKHPSQTGHLLGPCGSRSSRSRIGKLNLHVFMAAS